MKSILNDLFNSRIFPNERIVPKDPEYRLVSDKILEKIDYFEKSLSKEEYEKLENLLELHAESSSMTEEQSFIYGFKLGSILMVEVFMGIEKIT